MKRFALCVLALPLVLTFALPARAQDWPAGRPVRFIAPFGAGGATDVLTRVLAQRLTTELGNPFIVENRGGAGGNIGAAAVAQAAPDGYTLLMGGPGAMSYNKALYRNMPLDPDKDLDPVSLYARIPNVLVINKDVPAKNVAEFIAYAKARPGQLNFGSIGVGASSFLSAELFKSMAGLDIQHVAYSSQPLSLTDLMTGRTQMVIDNLPTFLPVIQEGRIRPLGVSTAARSPLLPEVPSISEAGVPGYEASSWIMVAVPAGTSPAITGKLVAAMKKVAAAPEFRARLAELGAEPVAGTPEEARAFIKQESAKWGAIIAKTGARAD
jgi:tripartite-type tricarboxylate transporter receptor subunit TctC